MERINVLRLPRGLRPHRAREPPPLQHRSSKPPVVWARSTRRAVPLCVGAGSNLPTGFGSLRSRRDSRRHQRAAPYGSADSSSAGGTRATPVLSRQNEAIYLRWLGTGPHLARIVVVGEPRPRPGARRPRVGAPAPDGGHVTDQVVDPGGAASTQPCRVKAKSDVSRTRWCLSTPGSGCAVGPRPYSDP